MVTARATPPRNPLRAAPTDHIGRHSAAGPLDQYPATTRQPPAPGGSTAGAGDDVTAAFPVVPHTLVAASPAAQGPVAGEPVMEPGQPAVEPIPIGAMAHLRQQVADRLGWFLGMQAGHAWRRRYSDPLSAHGVAFFYAQPGLGRRYTLHTATRLFLEGPEAEHLPVLLADLAGIAQEYRLAGDLDPRVQMADRAEPMSADAHYLGVGVSTLDTPVGRWADIQTRAVDPSMVPGRGFAALPGGTAVLVERGGDFGVGAVRVRSNRYLGTMADPVADLTSDPATAAVWRRLHILHLVLGGDR